MAFHRLALLRLYQNGLVHLSRHGTFLLFYMPVLSEMLPPKLPPSLLEKRFPLARFARSFQHIQQVREVRPFQPLYFFLTHYRYVLFPAEEKIRKKAFFLFYFQGAFFKICQSAKQCRPPLR